MYIILFLVFHTVTCGKEWNEPRWCDMENWIIWGRDFECIMMLTKIRCRCILYISDFLCKTKRQKFKTNSIQTCSIISIALMELKWNARWRCKWQSRWRRKWQLKWRCKWQPRWRSKLSQTLLLCYTTACFEDRFGIANKNAVELCYCRIFVDAEKLQ